MDQAGCVKIAVTLTGTNRSLDQAGCVKIVVTGTKGSLGQAGCVKMMLAAALSYNNHAEACLHGPPFPDSRNLLKALSPTFWSVMGLF